VRVILRTAIGMALFAGGLTFLTYGIVQAIEVGSCGTDEYGRSVGPACPDGFGPMIALMVFGAFGGLVGASIASSGGWSALAGGTARFFGVALIAVPAAVVLGFVDLHPDDTRPGYEVIAASVVPILLLSLPTLGKRPKPAPAIAAPVVMASAPQTPDAPFVPVTPVTPAASAASAPKAPVTRADAEEIASRLRQLEQLKESGLLSDQDYNERRRQILSEL
jgi:hypothetical protein